MRRTDYLKASPPMFESRLLDRFTRVHPVVPVLIYAPVVVAMLVLAVGRDGWWDTVGLAFFGYVLWTLFEYWLHRIVFHFEPEDGFGAKLHWMIHGVHHDHPNDPLRLVMPPAASIPLATLFIAIWQLVFGFGGGWAVSAGFLTGYLGYDLTHYFVHHGKPRGPIGRKLRELHMRHHFEDGTRGYGVSAPYWDKVFGTAPRPRREA